LNYYSNIDNKHLTIEFMIFNPTALRYVLRKKIVKTEFTSVFLILMFVCVDIFYNFRIITKAIDEDNNLQGFEKVPFQKSSIFELFFSDERMHHLILRLAAYSIIRLSLSFSITYFSYVIVS